MTSYFCLTIRFLQPYAHGRGESGEPEWPPSPLRAYQALVAASAARWNERERIRSALAALKWLEAQPPPEIVAPLGTRSSAKCQFYVPDNTAELQVPAWKRGDDLKQVRRTEKVSWPTRLGGEAVHYLYAAAEGQCPHLSDLTAAARSVTHLGWGVDMVVGDAGIISDEQAQSLVGQRWRPGLASGVTLRVPTEGTLDDLARKHEAFLNRVSGAAFTPVPPLKVFRALGYRRAGEPLPRPYRVFELRQSDGDRFRYPHRKVVHIAGMVRHLAIKAMRAFPPTGLGSEWVESYVAGHRRGDESGESKSDNRFDEAAGNDNEREDTATGDAHRQLSYLALPSIGHLHTDPGVRRVMIVAPVGDDAWLDHVVRHLAGQRLEPLRGDEFAGRESPLLVPVRYDRVAEHYTRPANAWASFTPVILPGHDDHKPEKTCKLIEKTLAQSGIEQPCQFEWSAISRFPKAYTAHKYVRDGDNKRQIGYIRPSYLLGNTAVHLTLRFDGGVQVPGPLAIGAGRHCGLGLMVAIDDS